MQNGRETVVAWTWVNHKTAVSVTLFFLVQCVTVPQSLAVGVYLCRFATKNRQTFLH